jgi:NAD-reducing hydrogenase large subunit
VTSSFMYHYARLIEILAALERIQMLLEDPDILSPRVRASGGINKLHGVGVSEAPRGTLFHDYEVDERGMIRRVNLIIATGQNNIAMNRTVKQIAQHWIHGATNGIPEGLLNRVEAGIRAFDPCLSCSTHAIGQMPMVVTLIDSQGRVIAEARRD